MMEEQIFRHESDFNKLKEDFDKLKIDFDKLKIEKADVERTRDAVIAESNAAKKALEKTLEEAKRDRDAAIAEITNFKKALKNTERERDTAKTHFRLLLICVILVIIVSAGFIFYKNYETAQRAGIIKQQADAVKRAEEKEREEINRSVQNILYSIKNDPVLNKFLETGALSRFDCIRSFDDKDYFIDNNILFCRDYVNTPSEYAFLDLNALKSGLISLKADYFSVRSDKRFLFSINNNINNNIWPENMRRIENTAFFTVRTLTPEPQNIIDIEAKLRDLIKNKIKTQNTGYSENQCFRFFFSTAQHVSIMAVLKEDSNSFSYYIYNPDGSNNLIFNRKQLINSLWEKMRLSDSINDEIEVMLWENDSRLNNKNISFNDCISIFLEQLLKRQNIRL